jgi:hypothetical protein
MLFTLPLDLVSPIHYLKLIFKLVQLKGKLSDYTEQTGSTNSPLSTELNGRKAENQQTCLHTTSKY